MPNLHISTEAPILRNRDDINVIIDEYFTVDPGALDTTNSYYARNYFGESSPSENSYSCTNCEGYYYGAPDANGECEFCAEAEARDWKGDFKHDSGRNHRKCLDCKRQFKGVRHRTMCKECADAL